jgi:hypothetical protein
MKLRRELWFAIAAATVVAAVVWPVQAIIMLVLLATVVVLVDVYERWVHRHSFARQQRHSFDSVASGFALVFLTIGAVFSVVATRSAVFVVMGIALLAFVLWCTVSATVWLIAMRRDLQGIAPVPHPTMDAPPRPRRPRPMQPIATLPSHPLRSRPHRARPTAARPSATRVTAARRAARPTHSPV